MAEKKENEIIEEVATAKAGAPASVAASDNFDWDAYENDGVSNNGVKKEDLEKAYENTLNTVKEHEVVEGTVIAINKREVVVNIGFKSDGVISTSEFRYNPDLKVGDKVITGKYTGTEVKLDGVNYTVVSQSDVLAVVE